MDLVTMCNGTASAYKWADLIAANGAGWEIDGVNVLALARDAKRWDILELVLQRDVPDYLKVLLSDCSEAHQVSVLRAYAWDFAQEQSCAHVGTLFPLAAWYAASDGAIDDGWLRFVADWRSTADAFLPTRNNPPRWQLDGEAIHGIAENLDLPDFESLAYRAAAGFVAEQDPADTIVMAANRLFTDRFGPHREVLPDLSMLTVYLKIDDHRFLVVPEDGGWAIRSDAILQGASPGERVRLVIPLPQSSNDWSYAGNSQRMRSHFGSVGF